MADFKKVTQATKERTAAQMMNYADKVWKKSGATKPSPERAHLYTKHGTLKEGAYRRAKDGGELHEDEVEGALEHAEAEGDKETAKKLKAAHADLQTGARGGKFYVGPSGRKVYVKDY